MSSYIIRFDEYDEPFLAHASGAWKDHKYLMKVPNAFGDGKTLYLYTQKEIDAYRNHGRRTLSNKIRDILGYDERDRRNDAGRARDSAQSALDRSQRNFEYTRSNQNSNREKNLAVMRNRNANQAAYQRSKTEFDEAESAYNKTILGKLEKVKKFFGNLLSSISGRNRAADEVIDENADVTMNEINKQMAESQSAAIDAQTGSNQRVASPEAKTAASQNRTIEGSSGSVNDKAPASENQNGSKVKEDTSDIKNMRRVALEVLRGDHGGGEERVQKLISMGYDPKQIQILAGNLRWTPNMSDERLREILNM